MTFGTQSSMNTHFSTFTSSLSQLSKTGAIRLSARSVTPIFSELESLFKAILRKLDFSREQFEKDISDFSDGQKKKVMIAASLCTPAHLYIWDEPLNYLDISSRRQLEDLIISCKPSMLIVEHDKTFCEAVNAQYCKF